jgi:hypothetical protein
MLSSKNTTQAVANTLQKKSEPKSGANNTNTNQNADQNSGSSQRSQVFDDRTAASQQTRSGNLNEAKAKNDKADRTVASATTPAEVDSVRPPVLSSTSPVPSPSSQDPGSSRIAADPTASASSSILVTYPDGSLRISNQDSLQQLRLILTYPFTVDKEGNAVWADGAKYTKAQNWGLPDNYLSQLTASGSTSDSVPRADGQSFPWQAGSIAAGDSYAFLYGQDSKAQILIQVKTYQFRETSNGEFLGPNQDLYVANSGVKIADSNVDGNINFGVKSQWATSIPNTVSSNPNQSRIDNSMAQMINNANRAINQMNQNYGSLLTLQVEVLGFGP